MDTVTPNLKYLGIPGRNPNPSSSTLSDRIKFCPKDMDANNKVKKTAWVLSYQVSLNQSKFNAKMMMKLLPHNRY